MFRKSLSIELIEPVVCLRGNPKDKQKLNILRGVIKLKLSSSSIIHSIVVQLIGISKTLWPEATQHWDKHILIDTSLVLCKYTLLLKKGIHSFPFEILLSNALSESIECDLGNVRYKLLCQVQVKPKFFVIKNKSTLRTQRPVVLVRLPSLENQQQCITQTHIINDNTNGQLTLVIEKSFILPGTSLPISFYFNTACALYMIDQITVRLVERQKYRAPTQQTTRMLHHELLLNPSVPLEHMEDEWRTCYLIPEKQALKLNPSTTHPHIRVRHWIQIYLRLLFIDGTIKELQIDAPISLLLASLDHYLHLPKYEQSESSLLSNTDHLLKLITAPPPLYHELL